MRWLCRLIGHGCRTVQSDELCSWIAPDHWIWPGVITYCPRCGFIFRSVHKAERHAPDSIKGYEVRS